MMSGFAMMKVKKCLVGMGRPSEALAKVPACLLCSMHCSLAGPRAAFLPSY